MPFKMTSIENPVQIVSLKIEENSRKRLYDCVTLLSGTRDRRREPLDTSFQLNWAILDQMKVENDQKLH